MVRKNFLIRYKKLIDIRMPLVKNDDNYLANSLFKKIKKRRNYLIINTSQFIYFTCVKILSNWILFPTVSIFSLN